MSHLLRHSITLSYPISFMRSLEKCKTTHFWADSADHTNFDFEFDSFILFPQMSHLSPEAKHHILLEYSPRDTTHSFAALARRHGIKGGARTVQRWHSRWNRTPLSLEEQPRSGRPTVLSTAEVSRHIRAPILAANRSHRAISYTKLLPEIQRKTRKSISIQTLRRIGMEQLEAKSKATRKRTREEREYTCTKGSNERESLRRSELTCECSCFF